MKDALPTELLTTPAEMSDMTSIDGSDYRQQRAKPFLTAYFTNRYYDCIVSDQERAFFEPSL